MRVDLHCAGRIGVVITLRARTIMELPTQRRCRRVLCVCQQISASGQAARVSGPSDGPREEHSPWVKALEVVDPSLLRWVQDALRYRTRKS